MCGWCRREKKRLWIWKRCPHSVTVQWRPGGGSIVLPGPNGSDLADQEFGAYVLIGRAQRAIGRSFVSVLATNRQSHDGQGHNTVIGPDFQWRWKKRNRDRAVAVQREPHAEPARPRGEWTGRSLSGTRRGFFPGATIRSISTRRRSPQHRQRLPRRHRLRAAGRVLETYGGGGWTFRPSGFVRRLRMFVNTDPPGRPRRTLVSENFTPGFGMDMKWSGFLSFAP